MKAFVESTQAQDESQGHFFKARTLETYWGKSYIKCYHFCLQYKNYFKISGTTKINCILFAALFFHSFISFKRVQHKRRHKNAISIMWSEFKTFFQKNFGSFQAFINRI